MNVLPARQNTTPNFPFKQVEPEPTGYRICPLHGDHSRPTNVYVLGLEGLPYVKIGVAFSVEWRINEIQASNPHKVVQFASRLFCCKRYAHQNERELHRYFSEQRVRGEWFLLEGDRLRDLIATMTEAA